MFAGVRNVWTWSFLVKKPLSGMYLFNPFLIWRVFFIFKVLIFHSYGISTQECFKAAWSSHKAVHVKAQLSSIAKSLPGDQNSDLISQGWLYCIKKGQARTPKLPHFDWTGFVTKISHSVILFMLFSVFMLIRYKMNHMLIRYCVVLLSDFGVLISSCLV